MFPVLVHLIRQMKWFMTGTDNLDGHVFLIIYRKRVDPCTKFYSETSNKQQQQGTTTEIETFRV